ncbi:unnamed protein product [Mycena citricolor]|uniref:F-box domain-containing protein n=1 Tax=Mycena citricolor TaxID=2018698 RepID=A0AAD2JZN2_9AGAR|nr:unnamed protein product [Mycena citricolor]
MSLPNSPFSDLLGTNYVPQDDERERINRFLVSPIDELRRLNHEIREVEERLHALCTQRDELETEIGKHKALVSLVRRLPDELLGEIFCFCIAAYPALVDPRTPPICLGHVSREWRRVSHSTPELWSSLHVPHLGRADFGVLEDERGRFVDLALEWVARSGSHPLYISSTLDELNTQPVQAVARHAWSHIANLCLIFPAAVPAPTVASFLQLELPALHTLHVECHSDFGSALWADAAVLRAPRLRVLLLRISADAAKLVLPAPSLVEFDLKCLQTREGGADLTGGLSVHHCLDIVRRCPALRKAVFRCTLFGSLAGTGAAAALPPSGTPSALREVHFYLGNDLPVFFANLGLPALAHLRLTHPAMPGPDHALFFASLEPHLAVLATAELSTAFFSNDTLLALLRATPRLRRLKLDGLRSTSSATLTNDMVRAACSEGFASELEVLECGDGSISCSDKVLERFVLLRPTLVEVRVRFSRYADRDIAATPAVRARIENGLAFSARYKVTGKWHYQPASGTTLWRL